jgi:hypothetical protein
MKILCLFICRVSKAFVQHQFAAGYPFRYFADASAPTTLSLSPPMTSAGH